MDKKTRTGKAAKCQNKKDLFYHNKIDRLLNLNLMVEWVECNRKSHDHIQYRIPAKTTRKTISTYLFSTEYITVPLPFIIFDNLAT
jgi:hypothetical protein